MRKYGKFERMPDGTRAKPPKVKNVLLQTYFTSLLCMVLCVSMFFGTSYAWFTSEVNNVGNEIYIGTLKVGLYKGDTNLNGSDTKLFDGAIRWEPGYTALETVRVVDEGDLAFGYELRLKPGDGSELGTLTLQDVAKWFDVWCYRVNEDNIPAITNYEQIKAVDSGWVKVGSLDQLLSDSNMVVFKGDMTKEEVTAATPAAHTYMIALHMNGEEVTETEQNTLNMLMGKKLTMNVKLVAYQKSSETDGFGNAEYDQTEVKTVSSVQQLIDAIGAAEAGSTINVAAGTYDFTETPIDIDKALTLQAADPANKPELQFVSHDGTGEQNPGIQNGIEIKASNVVLKNLVMTVDPAMNSTGNIVQISPNGNEYYSNILIDGCEFRGSDHCIAMYGNNVTIQNCILDESTADDQGNILYVWGTSGKLTVRNNKFVGSNQKKHGISFYYQSEASAISGEILIEGNTFENVYKGIVHESDMTYTDVKVQVLNNVFSNCKKKPVAIDNGTFESYLVNGNIFKDIDTPGDPLIDNSANAVVNANGNYWGSEAPSWDIAVKSANITVENYYADEAKTDLRTK